MCNEKKYHKLVRDRIPEIIINDNKQPMTHTADDEEYIIKLYEKIFEEFQEFQLTPNAEEMADIIEVLECISKYYGIKKDDIFDIKQKKQEERGSFTKKIILDKVKGE